MLTQAILAGQRAVTLPVGPVHPGAATEDADRIGRELIEESTTPFIGAIPEKAHNIQLAAERLDGVVVPPGATFSFNKEVGPTTLEAGFQWGFGLTTEGQGGVHTVPSVAGGICQVATTLFQSVFWAGYPVEERYSHAYWIPAYASRGVVGLDVTVDPDANLDFKWTNATSDYVLIQSGVQGDTVEFALYGKRPGWRVEVDPARTSNPRPSDPTPIRQEEPGLAWGSSLQVESPRDGFDVDVTRRVTPVGGGEPRTLRLHSSYAPSRSVTLVGTGGRPN
jgi:vancomycin resistance protein YoaR